MQQMALIARYLFLFQDLPQDMALVSRFSARDGANFEIVVLTDGVARNYSCLLTFRPLSPLSLPSLSPFTRTIKNEATIESEHIDSVRTIWREDNQTITCNKSLKSTATAAATCSKVNRAEQTRFSIPSSNFFKSLNDPSVKLCLTSNGLVNELCHCSLASSPRVCSSVAPPISVLLLVTCSSIDRKSYINSASIKRIKSAIRV